MSISYGGDYITDTDGGKLRPSSAVMRNRIINGAMVIDQRNAGASGTATGYCIDRWNFYSGASTKGTWQQNAGSVTPPSGFTKYLGFTSNSSYSVASGDFFTFTQFIEGYNIADLNWGSASAKTITISAWVYSSLTGTFGGAVRNGSNNYSYPFTYTISSANTWTQISVTIAGPTSGTFATDNNAGFALHFGLGVGSTYSGTAGSWSANNYVSATGAVSVVGTSGATFYITGVQLEVGSSATGYEYRQYGQELALCQRYYWKQKAVDGDTYFSGQGFTDNSTTAQIVVSFPVSMRIAPTSLEQSGTAGDYRFRIAGANVTFSAVPAFLVSTTWNGSLYGNVASGLTAGGAVVLRAVNSNAYLGWSAEL